MNIKEIISQMTLEEKCSLLSGGDFWHTRGVERLGIKPVMVSDGPHGLRKQDEEGDHLGINDSIKAVCMPAASATAASFDRELLRQVGEAVGDACQHESVAVNLGPAVNIKRSPLCGRNFEYFSEDPYLAGELSCALVKAVQSRNVGVSVKHFAANSQENRRMSSDSVVDERTLREIYFPAFEKCVKDGHAWTIMCSYNRLNGTYASQNPWLLTKVLRDEWGFDGYVMTDWGACSDRVKGLIAGQDLEMPSSGGENDALVAKAVREGKLDEAYVDQAVERILTVHQRYFDHAKPETVWDKEAQHELAGELAAECMVLLKNDDDILPLKKEEKIAVIGKFAAEPRYQGGGSSHINSFKVTSLLDALESYENVAYAKGYDVIDEKPDESLIAEAVALAAKADKAVILAGLPDSFESEGYDRTHLRMPECQNELIRRIAEVNKNVIVVLYNGSPVVMPWLPCAKAVVEAYLGGQNIGTATRKVLFGEVSPCGRLPETFPLALEHNPSYLTFGGDVNTDTVIYNEGVFVGYRYYEKKKLPVQFPFGYGLSYTSFAYSKLRADKTELTDKDVLTVSVDVTNTGAVAGKEVVQLYVAPHESEVARPVRELKEFAKVFLAPGETKTVQFQLSKSAFAYWSVELNDWYVESGEFCIQICRSSSDVILSLPVTVTGTEKIKKTFTADSIVADIMKDEKAMAVIEQLMKGMMAALGADPQQVSGDSPSAISADMAAAMFKYMPLRSLLSFSGGAITREQLDGLLQAMNS